jgi:hypothetical protein
MRSEGTQRLGKLMRQRSERKLPLDLEPANAYEVVTRRMVEEVGREVQAVRQRIDGMFYLVITSIAIDVLLRLAK